MPQKPIKSGIFCAFKSNKRSHFGGDSNEDPPVLIPNTEVKLVYAESTDLDTDWEDRKLPNFKNKEQ